MKARVPILQPLLASLAALSLTGCLVGPDYSTPEYEIPEKWSSDIQAVSLTPQELATWWDRFDDPVLSELIGRARTDNIGLRRALARIEEVRARRGLARAEWFPDLDLSGGMTRSRTSLNGSNSNVSGFQFDARTLYDAGLELSWELDLFGRVRRSVQAARADVDAAVWDLRDILVLMQAEVANAYIDYCSALAQLDITRQNLQMQTDSSSIANARFESGIASEADVTQANTLVYQTTATLPGQEAQVLAAKNRLCVLLGVPPGSLDDLLAPVVGVPRFADQLAAGIPADALRQRPDVRKAERELASQTARIGVATADLYPSFSFNGSFSYESSSTSDLFERDSEAFRFGPKLRWNLIEFGRVRQAIRVEDARAQARLADYEESILTALEEVENALNQHAAQIQRRGSLSNAISAARRAAELVQVLYEEGEADYQNLLDALRTQADLDTTSVDNETALARATIDVFRALGGGWQDPNTDSDTNE